MIGKAFHGTRADPPQRYLGNYGRHLARGGIAHLEDDIRLFTAHGLNGGDMARFHFFRLAFEQIAKEGVPGDLAELGVYKGNTAALIAAAARRLGRTAYLFDTFAGFDPADLRGLDENQERQFADTSLDAVRAFVGEDATRYVVGHFPDSLAQVEEDPRFCLVHIDCDLQAPITTALEWFYPRMAPGGFIVVHDYGSLAWDGAERAVDMFFATRPEPPLPLPDGATSIAVRKARAAADTAPGWFDTRRLALFGVDWQDAGGHNLGPILGPGWSESEDWGVWGVGARHELVLCTSRPPPVAAQLETNVHTLLGGPAPDRIIDVFAAGAPCAEWHFDADHNHAERSAPIPAEAFLPVAPGVFAATVEFRPRILLAPCDIEPGHADTRSLGLALHRIRRAPDR